MVRKPTESDGLARLDPRGPDTRPAAWERCWSWLEIGLIFLLFCALAATPPPDVNEAHYLAKAKHYWDPAWCRGDFFLESADAHVAFYWTAGWLTRFLSLEAVAWTGRIVTWALLACAWHGLSRTLISARFCSVLTAGLFAALLQHAHMAGEWVIGGFEAKGLAYVLVLFALQALVSGRWLLVWPLLGLASSYHVLVGGWSVVAAFLAWLLSRDRTSWSRFGLSLCAGFLLALPGLLPSAALTWGTEGEIAHQAARVYVFERLGHHLVFHRLASYLVQRHLALLGVWLLLVLLVRNDARFRRLCGFVAGAVLLAVIGAAVDYTLRHQPTWAASLLRFYWFRLSDVALPLGVSLCAVACATWLQPRWPMISRVPLWTAGLLVVGNAAATAWQHQRDWRPGAVAQTTATSRLSVQRLQIRYRAWREACRWIAVNTPPDATFYTPRYQQTFKWYAERPEAVNWKDVPQDARGLVEWWQRMQDLYPRTPDGLSVPMHQLDLPRLAQRYGFRYLLVDRTRTFRRPPYTKVFPRNTSAVSLYEVYCLTPRED
jgi:hypothetical protein